MIEKLFILGLPGSGKSALARFVLKYASLQQVDKQKDQISFATRFNDYEVLLEMFHQDLEGRRFKLAHPSGFDVLDLKVFDEALQTLEREVNAYIDSPISEGEKLVLIEFSRNDYYHAFRQFNESFLKGAYFLYLDTELEKCKQRIYNRSFNPINPKDDYPVSEYIFEKYYHADDWTSIIGILAKDFGVDIKRVWTFCNNNSFEMACMEISLPARGDRGRDLAQQRVLRHPRHRTDPAQPPRRRGAQRGVGHGERGQQHAYAQMGHERPGPGGLVRDQPDAQQGRPSRQHGSDPRAQQEGRQERADRQPRDHDGAPARAVLDHRDDRDRQGEQHREQPPGHDAGRLGRSRHVQPDAAARALVYAPPPGLSRPVHVVAPYLPCVGSSALPRTDTQSCRSRRESC